MEKFQPKVSVIIPVYNGEDYITEAIDSVLNQTYKNIEIVIINDGSKDNTEKLCLAYGKKIKYFSKENGGVSTALNLGIEKMTGDYFAWLSHDDLYKPEKIQTQVDFLRNYKSQNIVLYHDYELMDSQGKYLYEVIMKHNDLINYPYRALCLGCLNGITMLIPKDAFNHCGLFNPNLRVTQDYDMWRRIISKYDFVHLTDILTKTRLHPAQDTNTSPKVLTEGNALWTSILESTDDITIEQNFGNHYNYFKEMYNFLLQTPYKSALARCKKLLEREMKDNPSADISVFDVNIIYGATDYSALDSILMQSYKKYELNIYSTNDLPNPVKTKLGKFKIKYTFNKISEKDEINLGTLPGDYFALINDNGKWNSSKLELQINDVNNHDNIDIFLSSYHDFSREIAKTIEKETPYLLFKKFDISTLLISKRAANNLKLNLPLNKYKNILPMVNIMNYFSTYINKEKLVNSFAEYLSTHLVEEKDYLCLMQDMFSKKTADRYENDKKYIIFDYYCLIKGNNGNHTPYEELYNVYNSKSWKMIRRLRQPFIFTRNILRVFKKIIKRIFGKR